jgi:NADH-quinone oxidoreductase subunit N
VTSKRSNEAALKYLLLGAFASGFLLFGIALIFGATGSTLLGDMAVDRNILAQFDSANAFFIIGVAMLIVGIGFKAGLVPFHMWVPDVYQGSPTPVTAFMAIGPKAAAFALLFRLFGQSLHGVEAETWQAWHGGLWVIAVATMSVANLSAIRQTQLKRMLAYSSVAHAGYILMAVLASRSDPAGAAQAMLFYIVAYAIMKAGAFAVVCALQRRHEGDLRLSAMRGLSSRRPALAAAMAVFMFSLAGIPPTAGFVAKLCLLKQAWGAGLTVLTIVAVLNSVVAAYYYLRVVVAMYMEPEEEEAAEAPPRPAAVVLAWVAAAVTVLIGVLPAVLFRVAGDAGDVLAAGPHGLLP